MIFVDFISLMGDFCLYAASIGFVLGLGGEIPSMLILGGAYLLSIIAFLLMRDVKSPLRFLPILLMLPTFLFAKTVVGVLWPAPLCILLLMRAATRSWSAEHSRILIVLKIALVVYAVLTLLSKASALYCRSSLPFFLAWLLISVISLRMLRAPGLDSLGARFKLLNVLLVVAIAAAVFLLSSDVCLQALKTGFVFAYNKIVLPVFLVVVYICIAIPSVIYYIVKLICALFGGGELPSYEPIIGEAINEEYRDTYEFKEAPAWIGSAATIVGVVLLLLICFLVFRKLMANRTEVSTSSGGIVRESAAGTKQVRSKRRFGFGNSPEDSLRSTYRSYLEFCARHDVAVDGSEASDIICRESLPFGGEEAPRRLRWLWLPARYSEKDITPEQAKEAKALLKDIREHASKASKS